MRSFHERIWRLTTPRIRVSVGDVGLENETDGFDLTVFKLDNEFGDLSAGKSDSEAGMKSGACSYRRVKANQVNRDDDSRSYGGFDGLASPLEHLIYRWKLFSQMGLNLGMVTSRVASGGLRR